MNIDFPQYSPEAALSTLAHQLAGEFENQAQAAAEPTWYVHLRLWQRPVPNLSRPISPSETQADRAGKPVYTLFLEQANVLAGTAPYRQRILQLTLGAASHDPSADTLSVRYCALKDPLKFRGAGSQPAFLEALSADELVSLPNSEAVVRYRPQPSNLSSLSFQAALPEGQLCSFEYGGRRRYVHLGFEVVPQAENSLLLLTHDKGIDPDTGQGLWGALMGPFEMVKQKSYPW